MRPYRPWVLIGLTALAIWFGFTDVLHQSDVSVFLRAGGDVLHGRNPYTPVDDPALVSGSAFVYPWLSAFLFAPLSVLPHPTACVVFYMMNTAAVVAGSRILGLRSGAATCALLLSVPVLRNAELGAVNALFFLAAAALWRWRDRTAVVAGACVFLIGTKLFLLPLLVWVVLTCGRRCATWTVGAVVSFFTFSFTVGPISVATYVHSMRLLSASEGVRGMTMTRLCQALLPGSQRLLPALIALTVILVVVRRRDERALFLACLCAGLMMTPILWNHYLVLVLLAVLVVRPEPAWAVGASAASWLIVGTAHLGPVGGLSDVARLELLYAAVVAIPLLPWPTDQPADKVAAPVLVGARR